MVECKDSVQSDIDKKVFKILNDCLMFCKSADYNPQFDIDPTKPLIEALTKSIGNFLTQEIYETLF